MFYLVMSCLLITLVKCLKGYKSLGSLCNVVKALIVSGNGQTNGQTMSPIELFWTAKNSTIFNYGSRPGGAKEGENILGQLLHLHQQQLQS